jgi:hypothetical protein
MTIGQTDERNRAFWKKEGEEYTECRSEQPLAHVANSRNCAM